MMGYLFILLLLVSRYFSVSTSVIGKGLLGNREESPSFERNKMPFQSERIPSFFFGIYEHFKTQTTRHGQERSMESLQAKRKRNSVTPLVVFLAKLVSSLNKTSRHMVRLLNGVTFLKYVERRQHHFIERKRQFQSFQHRMERSPTLS